VIDLRETSFGTEDGDGKEEAEDFGPLDSPDYHRRERRELDLEFQIYVDEYQR